MNPFVMALLRRNKTLGLITVYILLTIINVYISSRGTSRCDMNFNIIKNTDLVHDHVWSTEPDVVDKIKLAANTTQSPKPSTPVHLLDKKETGEMDIHDTTPYSAEQNLLTSSIKSTNKKAHQEKEVQIIWQSDQPYTFTSRLVKYQNVCLEKDSVVKEYSPVRIVLRVYNSKLPDVNTSFAYRLDIQTQRKDSYWLVEFVNKTLPSNYTWVNGTALFPNLWRDTNHVWLLWHGTVTRLQAQLNDTHSLNDIKHVKVIAPRLRHMSRDFRSGVTSMGYNDLVNAVKVASSGPVCYKLAIFGTGTYHHIHTLADIQRRAEATYKLTSKRCSKFHVLLLHRKGTRKITNIAAMKDILIQRGFQNVDIVSFEGMSIKAQIELIRCTSMLIGVQGSALAWYIFLPANAVVIEIVYEGWGAKYTARIHNEKPEIGARTLQCHIETPTSIWKKYAKLWFQASGDVIDDALKMKVLEKSSHTLSVYGNVYIDSDCKCDNHTFVQSLPNVDKYRLDFAVGL